jgi:hypothetical protein
VSAYLGSGVSQIEISVSQIEKGAVLSGVSQVYNLIWAGLSISVDLGSDKERVLLVGLGIDSSYFR